MAKINALKKQAAEEPDNAMMVMMSLMPTAGAYTRPLFGKT
jgi:hypothetical protein